METPWGDCVLLDMRHLGEKKINERLPLVRELATYYVGHDPVSDPVPVRPVIHFMMGRYRRRRLRRNARCPACTP